MRNFEALLGQTKEEIDSFMIENDADGCVGCPMARLAAADVLWRRKNWNSMESRPSIYNDLLEKNGAELIEKELKFSGLSGACDGYSERWSPDTPRPAGMCNSKDMEYSRIEITAGRILETFDWVLPPAVKTLIGIRQK
ncbi:MAG: hypothetical protein U5L95_01575 [Candidatus Saccharibacteria bacterium]|nr:hypothetical protein [Candidatus Saccharibacteria bacterium]